MNAQTLSFKVELKSGSAPEFDAFGLDARLIRQGLRFQPAAKAFITGADGRDYAFVFPSLFFTDPQLPGLEYVRNSGGTFELHRVLPDVTMGSGRDYQIISEGRDGMARFVIVDHGSEYDDRPWPFGHVWVATDRGNGFDFEQVSQFAAFNHAVAVGDLNNNGRVDIVSSTMGVKPGGVFVDLHAYMQQADGSYLQDRNFAQSIAGSWGSGAVAVADVNGNGKVEVIQVSYLQDEAFPNWGAVRILGQDAGGNYIPTSVLPIEGLFKTMGATRVVPFDYDLDGHLDLLVSFEGQYKDLPGRYTGNGLEIYRNDGLGNFTRVTPDLMANNVWSFEALQFREFEVVDFDGDGYPDIILNGWSGTQIWNGVNWDLSTQMFRNMGGKEFVQLSTVAVEGLSLPNLRFNPPAYARALTGFEDSPELFVMLRDGSVLTVSIEALYRNASEDLIAAGVGTEIKGYGGDDRFFVQGSQLLLDGGPGLDIAIYPVRFTEVDISRDGDQWLIERSGLGVDRLIDIERLSFTDQSLALDIDGIAGQAYRIYQAAFNRIPDEQGLGYWIKQMDNGALLGEVAQGFIGSAEFKFLYGEASDDGRFVELLYANVLQRSPDTGGYEYWLDALDAGLTRADVLAYFSESSENVLLVADAIGNGIAYTPYNEIR